MGHQSEVRPPKRSGRTSSPFFWRYSGVPDISLQFHGPSAGEDPLLSAEVRRHFLLIAKEAVNNIARHSAATEARIDFVLHTRCLKLRVSDNGRGFDGATCQQGNGLANIRRRATWLGGSAELRASPGEGTVITVIAPFRFLPILGGRSSSTQPMMDCLDPATISIVLVEDDRRIREGLRVLLEGTSGFHCINAWRSMEEALAHHWDPIPAVALIDIGLPGISGIEGLALLRERYPTIALVVLTVFDDDERIFNALCAGACGYLLKGTPPSRLLESIRKWWLAVRPCRPKLRGGW